MKRCMIFVFAALLLLILTACEAATQPPSPELTPAGTVEPTPPAVPEEDEPELDVQEEVEGETANSPQTYTIEQIQAALQQGQFTVGDWGEGNPQVISIQRVERVRDYFFLESADTYIDLTSASRYRVEVRFRQSLEDYAWWSEIFQNAEFFRRDGDYTILTDYYYFIDVNGEPESAFVLC